MQPQYAYQTAPMNMVPTYKEGGDVEQTYGLRNAAEQLRERGRNGDTILAHINPQEAGILKLMGGSGTINPYTGLPEFGFFDFVNDIPIVGRPLYKAGSQIGKEIERGVERIARNEVLGPIAQMAAAYFGGPLGAAVYAGVAAPGSGFDVKNAAKAAALTYAGQQLSSGLGQAGTPMDGSTMATGADPFMSAPDVNAFGLSDYATQQAIDAGTAGFAGNPIYQPSGIGSLENVVANAGAGPQGIQYPPDPNSFVSGAPAYDQYASAGTPTVTDVPTTSASTPSGGYDVYDYAEPSFADVGETPYTSGADVGAIPGVTTFPSGVENMPQPNIIDKGLGSLNQGYNNAANYISELPGKALDYASELPGKALDYATALPGKTVDAFLNANPLTQAGIVYGGYTAYQTKKELDDAKEEADRILADRANKKAEDIAWAKSVLHDYGLNYERLTAEEVARERGMAMGGKINSYDDEIGGDDGMMQGGIAALAKGGLPPRYLRGGGDGMSDSIRARIDGKQEARLADGEFVVPADVVSHLGNGSSNAGAKKLYAMMDRVRRSRTGKTRQAPEVNTRSMMPA